MNIELDEHKINEFIVYPANYNHLIVYDMIFQNQIDRYNEIHNYGEFMNNLEEINYENNVLNESIVMYKSQERKSDIILNLKKQIYDVSTEDSDNNVCVICYENFKQNDEISENPCNHKFHYDCIMEWGKYKNECPCCRTMINIINEEIVIDYRDILIDKEIIVHNTQNIGEDNGEDIIYEHENDENSVLQNS